MIIYLLAVPNSPQIIKLEQFFTESKKNREKVQLQAASDRRCDV